MFASHMMTRSPNLQRSSSRESVCGTPLVGQLAQRSVIPPPGRSFSSPKEIINRSKQCEPLGETIELHITNTILERSLILDDESVCYVESQLQQKFPPRTAARAAQRQIKLLFFHRQQVRVLRVLKQLEDLLSSSGSRGHEWETSFCVFLILTLLLDKTIGQAYCFCEGRIAFNGYEPTAERRKFSELVTLMERELFESCKEAFHHRYGTRKTGRGGFNPIRYGLHSWEGDLPPQSKSVNLIEELQSIMREYGRLQVCLG